MRIESLEISNFKILRHLKLDDIPDLVVIAGPNGSGKTALFDALRVFKESIATYSIRNQGAVYVHNLLQQIGPVITAGETEARITASIKISDVEKHALDLPYDHSGVLTGTATVSSNQTSGQQETAQLSYGSDSMHGYDPNLNHLQRLLGGYRSGSLFGVIDHIGPDRRFAGGQVMSINLSPENEETELQRLILNSDEKFTTLTQDLVMMHLLDMQERDDSAVDPRNYIDGVRDIFRHFLPAQEFVGVRMLPNLNGPPQIMVRSGGVEHEVNQLSSGQREILMTYTHLEKLRPSGSIILFDEPELHLHPALQRRVIGHLRRLLERGDNQIWVISHSEGIVDTTEYESLYAMTGQGDPAVELVEERADRIGLLQNLGASVGLQLISPRILFVEGDSDAELLPLLYGELPTGIAVQSTKGKGNLMRLSETAMRLLDEAVVDGQFYLVRDRDVEDSPEDVDALQKKHAGNFFTWKRYHIENYLLDEEAIYHVLADDPDLPDVATSDEVGRQLRDLADERKEYVLAKHLEAELDSGLRKRFRINVPDGVKSSLAKATEKRLQRISKILDPEQVEQTYEKISSGLEQRWDEEWKDLCIGRDVLRAFHQNRLGNSLGYDVFRNKVARKIRELNRIPQDVQNVMNSVTQGL